MLFKDSANKQSNQKHYGVIKSSNLCVAGETKILTNSGQIEIKKLVGKKVKVWNGFEWSDTIINKTGINKDLVEVKLSNGVKIKCTPEHNFYIQDKNGQEIRRRACELSMGDELIKWNLPENSEYVNTKNVKVCTVLKLDKREDTYCFTEHKRHKGIFNGILTGQCAEIIQYSDANEYGVCLTGDTNILTENGIKKIVDCDNENILCYYDDDVSLRKCEHYEKGKLICTGTKVVYGIKTIGQRIIKATNDHPFLVFKNNKHVWKKVEELEIGDMVATPRNKILDTYKISKNEYNKECLYDGLNHGVSKYKKYDKSKYPVDRASFLSGYFSVDGDIVLSEMELSVILISKSDESLYDIQSMLKPFGIQSIVKYNKEKSILSIYDSKSICNFEKYINFELCVNKKEKLKELIKKCDRNESEYSKVVSITELGEEIVYDLVLKKSHNFIANGYIVHNCNLNSICLPKFVEIAEDGIKYFNFSKLSEIAEICVENLDNIIDINYYPVKEAKVSNMKHRPIGVGVQGLADVFCMMGYPFDSTEAQILNKKIFETIYYGAIKSSNRIAKEKTPYETFKGSPFSQGQLQYHLWGLTEDDLLMDFDWKSLIEDIKKYGMRNSLLTALMPTASTSQIMNNNECLVGDTLITLNNGMAVKIENMTDNNLVLGWNNKYIERSIQNNKLDQGVRPTICLTFLDGRKVMCTPDHKFLTSNNTWIEAQNITLNKENIVCGLNGTEDYICEKEFNYKLKTDVHIFTMETKLNRSKTLAFVRIIGYLLADESIYHNKKTDQYTITFYMGSMFDVKALVDDLTLLGDDNIIISDNSKVFRVRPHKRIIDMIVSLKNIMIGRKSKQCNKLPDFILSNDCPNSVIREFLAGYFGGNGYCSFLSLPKANASTVRGIKLEHHVQENFITSLKNMMNDIKILLEKLGINGGTLSEPFKPRKNSYLKNDDRLQLRLSLPTGVEFEEKIGFRYCIQKMLRLSATTSYWRYKSNILKMRENVLHKAYEYYTLGNDKRESLQMAQDYVINEMGSIPLSEFAKGSYHAFKYYCNCIKDGKEKNIINQTGQIGISPKTYFKKRGCLDWFTEKNINDRNLNEFSHYTLTIIDIKLSDNKKVWDISIDKNHSFLANGVMVHNCFEPFTTNLYMRRTLAGEYIVINKHLVETLISQRLWTKAIREEFIYDNGSIQNIEEIPKHIKDLYKTAFEMNTKPLIDLAIGRGPFIDQSQSMNIFNNEPDFDILTSSHFYAWENKLKTGMYYLRGQPAVDPIKFGMDPDTMRKIKKKRSENKPESEDDTSTSDDVFLISDDPRRISEIEENQKGRSTRVDNFEECEMCGA
jgi:ribonucleotide reductase alpha subunit